MTTTERIRTTVKIDMEEFKDLAEEVLAATDAINGFNGFAELTSATVKVNESMVLTYDGRQWTLEVSDAPE